MGPIPVDPTLQEWSERLFKQPEGTDKNEADDSDGTIVTKMHSGKNKWLIPGTWGEVQKSIRFITVPNGKSLYVIVGSSHGTEDEIDTVKNPGETPESYAIWADGLWEKGIPPIIVFDSGSKQPTTVKTDEFEVKFVADNPYYKFYKLTRLKQKMVSVARIFSFTPTSEKSFTLIGMRPEDRSHGKNGEDAYELRVEYIIKRP